jgi:hypothetical protein
MMHKRPALVALMAMAALSAWATGSKQTMSRATDKQSVPAALKVPLLGEGLRLSDFSGMTPNPELKDKLLHVSGFIQNSPSDGKAAIDMRNRFAGIWRGAKTFSRTITSRFYSTPSRTAGRAYCSV